MKCPYCDVKVNFLNSLKISRWNNYVCHNCGNESSASEGNVVLVVVCVLIPLFSIDILLSYLQLPLHWTLYVTLAILLYYLADRCLGKLQKT